MWYFCRNEENCHIRNAWSAHGPARCGWFVRQLGSNLREGGLVMNQSEFEADLQRQGYQVFYGGLQAGMGNPDHAHDWDARVMGIGGEITLTRGGGGGNVRVWGCRAPCAGGRLARPGGAAE